ncbi:hypothetical protein HHK36_013027 [Tetracentron sinense]|uniref:DUF7794 domain-containing protein n=1 Tax=Tetracentron sinense TaxID=13715 RepID=A0A834Z9Z5_TETSI|nr:hypothetical protein HHK36_013027 [Tetracentron sinense]
MDSILACASGDNASQTADAMENKAEGTGSIFFLDSSGHRFFHTRSLDVVAETDSMSLTEVGAAVSVLLGFAPTASLSVDSSSKLNEILLPNPFDRPRAVLMLEVRGMEDPQLSGYYLDNAQIGSAFKSRVILGSDKVDIQLPDEDEVSMVSLNEPVGADSGAAVTEKDLRDLAAWLGGSYATAMEPLNGELTVPLASGAPLSLHMSNKADREFTESLLSLIHNIRMAIEMHEDMSENLQNPAELITGCFNGIKALQEQYGPKGVAQQGMELFLTALSKLYDSLQKAYKGQIVGVIFFNEAPYPESGSVLNVMFTSHPSSRRLGEPVDKPIDPIALAEVVLVRRVLAWITGIILLISTLLGVRFHCNYVLAP